MGQQWWAWLVLAQAAKQVQSWRAEQPSEPLRPAHHSPHSQRGLHSPDPLHASLALDLGQKRLDPRDREEAWDVVQVEQLVLALAQRSRSSPRL